MPSTMSRRIAALEDRQAAAQRKKEFKTFLMPCDLDAAAEAQWRAENVVAAMAAGCPVLVVKFVSPAPEPSAGSVSLARH